MRPQGYGYCRVTAVLNRIIQIKLNHSASAHEVMLQTLAEWNVGFVIVSESYRSIHCNDWRSDTAHLVAIYRNSNLPPLQLLVSGQCFVIVEWGGVNVIGIYTPPSR